MRPERLRVVPGALEADRRLHADEDSLARRGVDVAEVAPADVNSERSRVDDEHERGAVGAGEADGDLGEERACGLHEVIVAATADRGDGEGTRGVAPSA